MRTSEPEMGYNTTTTRTPARRIASFIARIVINGDRVGASAWDRIWLRSYGWKYNHCALHQILEIKDRSGRSLRILNTRRSDLNDGDICRVRFSNFATGYLLLEPYDRSPEFSRIVLFTDSGGVVNKEDVVAIGVVESVEYCS